MLDFLKHKIGLCYKETTVYTVKEKSIHTPLYVEKDIVALLKQLQLQAFKDKNEHKKNKKKK